MTRVRISDGQYIAPRATRHCENDSRGENNGAADEVKTLIAPLAILFETGPTNWTWATPDSIRLAPSPVHSFGVEARRVPARGNYVVRFTRPIFERRCF